MVAHFSRNYSAEMNMYYMNKHRQMALNSHQRILDAVRKTETSNEPETKNAILLQVAKTMFDIQETGYLKNGNNPVPTTQIVETIRTGVSKSN
jgi:DNA-binding FadR family transcriptional regulator